MTKLCKSLLDDENGLILSAELVIVLTVGVLAMVVCLNGVVSSISGELNDVSGAFGSIDQSYFYTGLQKSYHAGVAGSGYADGRDLCDCSGIWGGSTIYRQHCSQTYVAPPVEGPALVDPCLDGDCPPQDEIPCDDCEPTDKPLEPTEEAPLPEENLEEEA